MKIEARRATHAYATALGLALESAFQAPRLHGVQDIVDRISREPEIYGVLVYGRTGEVLFASDLLHDSPSSRVRVQSVLSSSAPATFERLVDENRVYSVIRPLRNPRAEVIGAFEVAQPLSFAEAQNRQSRNRFLLNTLTLLAAVSGVILWLVRRMIARPLGEFVTAAQALGRGELAHRIRVDARGGELADLASEFNRMADKLEGARAELLSNTEERLSLETRLRQTEKMAAIGKLAAGLAHEIAAPLNVVAGRAELLQKKEMPRELTQKNLRIIIDQIGRITFIVRNLLDFARRREPRLRPLDTADVLESVLEFLDGEFERAGIEVHKDLSDEVCIMGDPNLLHQVFLNLLLNSVQALEGATGPRVIWVRLSRATQQILGQPEYAAIEIKDSGPGILEDHLADIFEPFFTTKSGGEGTGLGLAVVRGIIEEHGGSISGGNWSDGAVFRVSLPTAPEIVSV
ncbi:MAG: HAMP domain-containing protein [Gemmatimonadetes bacterium]|nr:HAMP domain-containing protein [Gemmatimonadota bacterium]